jgi:hypothetical protein
MDRSALRIALAFAFTIGLLNAATALSAQRTFVASTGIDSNPCSIGQPCRGFAAAVVKTDAGGELIVLDSAGFGPVTIAQSISIVAAPGIYAGITAFSGTGIYVHGTGISVALKGLKINGQGAGTGIDFDLGAKLMIEDCEISNIAGEGIHARAPDSQTTIAQARHLRAGSW